jgi:HD-GYP domain-containing protein (c-di-GMP phosphodiesterase class II)
MTSDRAYRPAIDIDAALQQLHRHAGAQFDTTVVEAFCKMKPAAALQRRTAPEQRQPIRSRPFSASRHASAERKHARRAFGM